VAVPMQGRFRRVLTWASIPELLDRIDQKFR